MRKTVKPARPGLLIRHPDTREYLPAEGLEVVWTSFWQRRLQDGDLEVVEAVKPAAKAAGRTKGS